MVVSSLFMIATLLFTEPIMHIFSNDTEVIRGDTSVTRKTTINYDKINIKDLLDIEGEEDNIIENGEAKVEKWISLAKKFGTKCEEVEAKFFNSSR